MLDLDELEARTRAIEDTLAAMSNAGPAIEQERAQELVTAWTEASKERPSDAEVLALTRELQLAREIVRGVVEPTAAQLESEPRYPYADYGDCLFCQHRQYPYGEPEDEHAPDCLYIRAREYTEGCDE